MVSFEAITKAVTEGDGKLAYELTKSALDADVSPNDILDKGLVPGLQVVGDQFESGDFFLPELIVAGDAVSKALELLDPVLGKEGGALKGKFLIGTVKGDIHDLGKNIVIMMLKGNGWDVTDLGVDISPDEFCTAVAGGDYDILGLSSLLTMTMPNAADTIEALKANGLRDKIKVMVGGAPTKAEWVQKIGADAHAKNGPSAARVAAELIAND